MKYKWLWIWVGCILLLPVLILLLRPTGQWETYDVMDQLFPVKNNPYDPEGYHWDGGFLRYEEGEQLVGIDVSTHQGQIDWQAVKQAGVDFAILRAGYRGSTVGDLYEDDCFAYNWEQARQAGVKLGVYFFSQALNEEEAVQEADYVCSLLEGKSPELPVFYDWEFIGGRVSDPGDVPMTECAIAFCERVRDHGFEAGVYFNQEYGRHYLSLRRLNRYTLWLAEYSDRPDFPYAFDCLQYTDSGTVPGIEGSVDLDLLFLKES